MIETRGKEVQWVAGLACNGIWSICLYLDLWQHFKDKKDNLIKGHT